MSKYLNLLSKNQFKVVFFISVAIVLYKALAPDGEPLFDFEHFDKIKHAAVFFFLSFLLNRSSSSISKRIRNVTALFLFGIFIEVLQSFTAYREVSLGDILANLVGILLFQSTYSLLKNIQLKKRKKSP